MASQVKSMFGEMFKSPSQVRQEQMDKLLDEGRRSAGVMMQGGGSGLSQAIKGHAANIAQYIPQNAERLKRGMLGAAAEAASMGGKEQAAGALRQMSMSPEELKAMEIQESLQKAKGDYAGMMAVGQELLQKGNAAEAYQIFQLAKDLKPEEDDVNTMDTNDMKNIAAIGANEFQCDVTKDPACFLKAKESYQRLKRQDQVEVLGYKSLQGRREKAAANAASVRQANSALQTLDSGDVNVGSFANTRQGAMKFASEVFGWGEGQETVARTAQLMSQVKQLAGEMLASGMFGAGTAISERDLTTAMEIAGASESLTPLSMKQILEINAKMNTEKVRRFNQSLERYSPEFFGRTIEGSVDNFRVPVDPLYNATNIQAAEQQPDGNMIPHFEGEEGMMFMVPRGSQVGTYKGTRGYMSGGKFYDFNGNEVK